jgi:uncharacterized membrane protein YedE/YeeE
MENFTPISALAGGALIGAAAVILMLFSGRIAGIAGIVGGLFGSEGRDWSWRLAFVMGLVAGPYLVMLAGGAVPNVDIAASLPVVVAGGVLVGFGTRLGNGCTSGHGVCGLARFSPRSAVATVTFMAVAALVVFLVRHWAG